MKVLTIGHGTRPAAELVECLQEAEVRTLVDVRRFPGSRRNPQFNQGPLGETLREAGIAYRHAVELGGRLRGEPGEERFPCIRVAAFRSYAARMGSGDWQDALERALAEPVPCLMCAETPWQRCHRRLIAELLVARGHEIVHLIRPPGSGKRTACSTTARSGHASCTSAARSSVDPPGGTASRPGSFNTPEAE